MAKSGELALGRRWVPSLTVILIISLLVVMVLTDLRMKASILEIARTQAQLQTVETINRAINDKIVTGTDYQDLVYIHKDGNGRVMMIQANTVIINQLMAQTVNEVIACSKDIETNTISVPLGQVTGFILLAGRGPKVNVRIIPVKQVHVEVINTFEQAGINQTHHIISFKINTAIKIAVPFVNQELNVATTVPLADTIIVGDIPQTYVNFSGTGQVFPPVPSQ